MPTIRDFCSEKQKALLDQVRDLMRDFYRLGDNEVTYALTGLINNLTDPNYTSPDYIEEKVGIIATLLAQS